MTATLSTFVTNNMTSNLSHIMKKMNEQESIHKDVRSCREPGDADRKIMDAQDMVTRDKTYALAYFS